MKRAGLLAYAAVWVMAAQTALAGPEQNTAVVAEIFNAATGECAYQPQGEQEINDILARTPDVLVLTCHDSYIKEPHLSGGEQEAYSGYCLKRRVEYAGAHNIFTFNIPMMVVNGQYDLNAAYPLQIPTGITMAHSFAEIQPIELSLTGDEVLHFALSPETAAAAEKAGGEYKTRLVAYRPETEFRESELMNVVNPITSVRDLGVWDKHPQSFSVPLTGLDRGALAVILQQEPYGQIIAAGRIQYN